MQHAVLCSMRVDKTVRENVLSAYVRLVCLCVCVCVCLCLHPQGREIIANLSKAAGLAQMIAAMRPDIDNVDEYVRNTTARAFSVVASALGIPALLPFLKAVCLSKKSWQVGVQGTDTCTHPHTYARTVAHIHAHLLGARGGTTALGHRTYRHTARKEACRLS